MEAEPVEFSAEGSLVRGDLRLPVGRARVPLVVLAHGLSSSRVEWYDFPARLAEPGYAALAFDFRGHGQSEGRRGHQSVDGARADLAAAIRHAGRNPRVDSDRVAIIGHSLGAALVAYAAPHLPLTCLILMAPVSRLRNEMTVAEHAAYKVGHAANALVRRLAPSGLYVPYRVDYRRLYEDPAAIERGRRDAFLQKTVPLANYRTLVQDLDAAQAARHIRCPTLVMVAEHDRIVQHRSSRDVYDALGGTKEWVEIPGSGHSMPGDRSAEKALAACRAFLDTHLRRRPR